MRILLDTNILFSALIADGNERRLVEKIIVHGHTVVFTDLIWAEIEEVCRRKLSKQGFVRAKKILEALRKNRLVYFKTKHRYHKNIRRALELINTKDAPILAAGLQAEIDWIVTGDKDFFNSKLKKIVKKKIILSSEALDLLSLDKSQHSQ